MRKRRIVRSSSWRQRVHSVGGDNTRVRDQLSPVPALVLNVHPPPLSRFQHTAHQLPQLQQDSFKFYGHEPVARLSAR